MKRDMLKDLSKQALVNYFGEEKIVKDELIRIIFNDGDKALAGYGFDKIYVYCFRIPHIKEAFTYILTESQVTRWEEVQE